MTPLRDFSWNFVWLLVGDCRAECHRKAGNRDKERRWARERWGKVPLWCKLLTWQLASVSGFILYHTLTKTCFVHYWHLAKLHMVAQWLTELCSQYRYTQDKVEDGPSSHLPSSIICGRLWPAPGVHVGSSQAVRSPVVHAWSAPDSPLSHSTGGWKPCELQSRKGETNRTNQAMLHYGPLSPSGHLGSKR